MCGVIGVYATTGDVFEAAVNGLFQMQHRGQDACGLALADGSRVSMHKGLGYVRQVFAERPVESFAGHIASGHVRYPTQGSNRRVNAQPHTVSTLGGTVMALSSNGDLTNYWDVRRSLEAEGVAFVGTNDAELLVKFIAWQHLERGRTIVDSIRELQRVVRGAYSSTLITRDRLYAIRDLYAVRPLAYGEADGMWMVASETAAMDISGVRYRNEVEPGEIVEVGPEGVIRYPHPSLRAAREGRESSAHCVFEFVYFSRPDSTSFGHRVYDVRKRIGAVLAEGEEVEADVVVPVPDSSNAIALGYAQRSGLPFEFGLIRNHYIGRTFISGDKARRDDGVKHKFNPQRSVFEGKRVILIDDSIVRGTTLRKIARMVRGAGATEVHIRIGSPITRYSCFYGVDTPTSEELIGNRLDAGAIRAHLTADSLRYLTVDELRSCVDGPDRYCFACFDGAYPIALTERKENG